jgi:hypothetical protein
MSPNANALCGFWKMSPLSFFFYLTVLCYTIHNTHCSTTTTTNRFPALHLTKVLALNLSPNNSLGSYATLYCSAYTLQNFAQVTKLTSYPALNLCHFQKHSQDFHTSKFEHIKISKCDPAYTGVCVSFFCFTYTLKISEHDLALNLSHLLLFEQFKISKCDPAYTNVFYSPDPEKYFSTSTRTTFFQKANKSFVKNHSQQLP